MENVCFLIFERLVAGGLLAGAFEILHRPSLYVQCYCGTPSVKSWKRCGMAGFRVISSFIIAIIQWKETPLGDFCQFLVTCL